MRWSGRERSGNVEDRRGMGGKVAIGGGIGGVIILVLSLLMGENPLNYIDTSSLQQGEEQSSPNAPLTEEEDPQGYFVGVVLKDTEVVWTELFQTQLNSTYQEPALVLFTDGSQSGCGYASSAVGPFYCPADQKVYIDLSFYADLQNRFDAPGDFAMAYVIAHEVGHHVQNLLGISDKMRAAQQGLSEAEANRLSVKLELQADFFAGVWAHHAQKMENILDPGDIEEALTAANAIGDDRLQQQSQGRVVPDAFTHGTSKQRMYWFKKGYETGDIRQGDTFSHEQ
ncbi:MAG: metalloprotease [Azospira oryzae]|nr:MAG: metalloprotease [Azospira oryzae]